MRKVERRFILHKCETCEDSVPWPNYSKSRAKPVTEAMYKTRRFCSKCLIQNKKERIAGDKNTQWTGGKPRCTKCGKRVASRYATRCKPCWFKNNVGENNAAWKERLTNYKYIHTLLRSKYGAPICCSHCGATTSLEWANKCGNYTKDINDYFGLCTKCHRRYDSGSPKWFR